MRHAWLILVLALGSVALAQEDTSTALADVSFDSVARQLASFETLRGEFTQTREIAALSQPLRSRGRFIISDLGLYWRQSEPFDSILIAGDDGLSQQVADRPAVTISAAEQPMAMSISRIFLGIFKGDRDSLNEHFDVGFQAEGTQWTMHLRPRTFPLTEAIEEIFVEGTVHLERLRIIGAADDAMTVHFSGHVSEPATLTEDERASYFP